MASRSKPTVEDELDLYKTGQVSTRTARILLAEDDTEMRKLLAWGLERDGYEVVEAENGLELLEYLEPSLFTARTSGKISEFDLVISDIRMPGLSGLEVLAGVRKRDKATPMILITAFGDPMTHKEAKELGASAVIDKPFDIDALREIIRSIIPPRYPSR
jgi:CheY-like chemotaxis protein